MVLPDVVCEWGAGVKTAYSVVVSDVSGSYCLDHSLFIKTRKKCTNVATLSDFFFST